MQYIILTSSNTSIFTAKQELEKSVKQYIQYGWVPQGGISTYATQGSNWITHYASQAMIKN